MEIKIKKQPHLLLDAADLVCAYVNGIEPQYLTGDGEFCIPAEEVMKMMNTVCADLDLESSRVRLYFRGYKLDENSAGDQRMACIAYILMNSNNDDLWSFEELRKALHNSYIGTGKPYKINSFGMTGFGWDACSDERSISDELDKQAMPDALRLRLAEVLSAYHKHVDQLCDLLEPLAERLRPLMEPWIEKLQPRIEQWQAALETEEKLRDFLSRFNTNLDTTKCIYLTPQMFYPSTCQGVFTRTDVLYCSAGVGLQIGQAERENTVQSRAAALRQLANADRIEMLRLMAGKGMRPREIARKLSINPGTVFRDLNNMCQVHLLKIVPEEGGYTYVTNLDYLKRAVNHLIEYIEGGE